MAQYQDDPALLRAKQDGAYLCEVLGITKTRDRDEHAQCPLCKSKCLRYRQEKSGAFVFQCMKGCGKGTIVDALMMVSGLRIGEAIQEAKSKYGGSERNGTHRPAQQTRARPAPQQEQKPAIRYGQIKAEPVLDTERAEELIKFAHEYLLEYKNIPAYYNRGISEEIIRKYRIGFIEDYPLKYHRNDQGRGWVIPHSWVLPITDGEGKVKAVKLHFEHPYPSKKQEDGTYGECEGKSRWAPFGLEPKENPNHGFQTIWPHPNSFDMPGTRETFSTDINWWIERMPKSGELAAKWDRTVSEETVQVAIELGKDTSDLDANELFMAWERAFDILKLPIQQAVCASSQMRDTGDANAIEWNDYTFVCPGELKALSVLSAGFCATGITGGEGWIPPPAILSPLSGTRSCVLFDDDPPRLIPARTIPGRTLDTGRIVAERVIPERIEQPGHVWADNMGKALTEVGALDVCAKAGGRRPKGEE